MKLRVSAFNKKEKKKEKQSGHVIDYNRWGRVQWMFPQQQKLNTSNFLRLLYAVVSPAPSPRTSSPAAGLFPENL